ncbi:MAG: 1-acyl-sn-glycerol-3-phosphate acyltransferase [Campylobacteraceae bacterium]|jgi:1-acyl-sn-glycerol-3-phosphate acyltransferase|nr:1-acyl-sn-glycerol-3-phosphate acyltransferase [Campylobacteraceae bacterium]
MLSKIRSVYTAFEFFITVAITIILMFFFRPHQRFFRWIWANSQKYLIGFKIDIRGKPDSNAKLLVVNHQSVLDIIVMEAIYPPNIAWVAKKEIFKLPFLGQSVKLSKMICLDREDKRAMVKLLKDVKDRIDSGRPVIIFPEGTRGKGEKLLKFQIGAKILAEKLNLTVQPVVIANARKIFDSQGFKVSSQTAIVSYLPSVNPKDNEEWYENLRDDMQRELTKLLSE